jgi:murein L,D-transpeptidase YafK
VRRVLIPLLWPLLVLGACESAPKTVPEAADSPRPTAPAEPTTPAAAPASTPPAETLTPFDRHCLAIADQARAFELTSLRSAPPLDQVARGDVELVITKAARRLFLLARAGDDARLIRSYRAGLGFDPVADKERQGDGRTPEGQFTITKLIPHSQYYKAFLLSYPEMEDAERGLKDDLITAAEADSILRARRASRPSPSGTALGGLIEIHGLGSEVDWTLGCIALENKHIDELWEVVTVGTKVSICR